MWGRGSGLKPLSSSPEETECHQNGARGIKSLTAQPRDERVPAYAREQDGEIYRNARNFLFSHSPPPCHFLFSAFSSGLCLTFCLSLCKHLLASFLQNTAILNVCSSPSLTIFALSFSVSSLLVKLISLMMIILNMVKWLLSHQSQFFVAPLSRTSQFHAFPCHIRPRNSNITFFFFLHCLLYLEEKDILYHIFLICSLRKPEM